MLNPFIIKKYASSIISGFLPLILFFVFLQYYGNLMYAIGAALFGMLLSIIVSTVLLKNPFTMMLEGKGILVFNIDSVGIIRPFVVGLDQPYIKGKLFGNKINDVYNREAVLSLDAPKKAEAKAITDKKGGIIIKLNNEEVNAGRFGMFQFPVFIWNNQRKSIMTKEELATLESTSFAKHGILFLNRRIEELTHSVRDFGRYIVEMSKPKESWLSKGWFWIIIVVLVGLLALMFLPKILAMFGVAWGGASEAAKTAGVSGSGAVIPK